MKTVVAAALGECVHVAGVMNFLRLAEKAGWRTIFLGPAVPIENVLEIAVKENAELVGVSYRLTPENGERLIAEFAEAADELRASGVKFVFGGTPPIVERIKKLGFFDACYDGSETDDNVLRYLQGKDTMGKGKTVFPQSTIERIEWKAPYPLIRHHFGLPSVNATIDGVKKIAEAGVLDVVSLGIDQDAQENFFHPERQSPRKRGAGGVPVRSPSDYQRIYQAGRRGNFPLIRSYTGTDDFIKLAEMYLQTIHNAWAAIPLFWFNKMDRRGPWELEPSIRIHQELMAWYAQRDIPVEVNEPHHWGMRGAPDVIYVVTAFLSAYNAKALGVKDYITALMFNSPPGLSDAMDLAKMLAVLELVEELADVNFKVWRQTRTGLLSYPLDTDFARGHLAASVYLQMALKPHIIHVVGYPEADHAVTADEVIESCKIAHYAIRNALRGQPAMQYDPSIRERKQELINEAKITIQAIKDLGTGKGKDPLLDPENLAKAVRVGILDAPQLLNNPYARGEIVTRIDKRGACITIEKETGEPVSEKMRIQHILKKLSTKETGKEEE